MDVRPLHVFEFSVGSALHNVPSVEGIDFESAAAAVVFAIIHDFGQSIDRQEIAKMDLRKLYVRKLAEIEPLRHVLHVEGESSERSQAGDAAER